MSLGGVVVLPVLIAIFLARWASSQSPAPAAPIAILGSEPLERAVALLRVGRIDESADVLARLVPYNFVAQQLSLCLEMEIDALRSPSPSPELLRSFELKCSSKAASRMPLALLAARRGDTRRFAEQQRQISSALVGENQLRLLHVLAAFLMQPSLEDLHVFEEHCMRAQLSRPNPLLDVMRHSLPELDRFVVSLRS